MYHREDPYNYHLKNDEEKAQDYYNQALLKIDENPIYGYYVAYRFETHALIDLAAKAYERSMELRPEANYHIQLARIYGEQGEIEKMFTSYVNFVEKNADKPFFLYLAHWGIHTPLQATREDYEAVGDIKPHRLRVYAAMMRALDRSVGQINDTLIEEGLADNTIVVFSSDNGGAGYIGLPGVNQPFRGWKLTNFEGGLRVPMFVKWPKKVAPGTRVSNPVAHIDLMPTLVAAADAKIPQDVELDGVDILPLATGDEGAAWDRKTLFWQSGYYRVVRHEDWKLQISDNPKKTWLFDLANDPTEQNNLATSEPEKLAELQALLAEHKASARDPLYPFVAEMPVAVDKTLATKFVEGDEYIYWPN